MVGRRIRLGLSADGETWTTKDGTRTALSEMRDGHLRNVIAMTERAEQKCRDDGILLDPDMRRTREAMQRELDRREDLDRSTFTAAREVLENPRAERELPAAIESAQRALDRMLDGDD